MALDISQIRTDIIASIQLSIGDQLTQQYNPELDESYGTIFNARPNPEISVPDYPYAVLDLTGIQDTDWYLTNRVYDESIDDWQWETHKTINFQITVFGTDSLMLAEQLATSYRRDDMISSLALANIAIADVELVQISPELLQTDFLEIGVMQMSIRVNDVFIDTDLESIENVILEGEIDNTLTGVDLEIYIDTQDS